MAVTPFEELFDVHVTRVVRLATLLGADDPEDVAQESFSRLYTAKRTFEPDEAVRYLNRIVVNEVRDRQRRASRSRSRHLHLVDHPAADEQVIRNHAISQLMAVLGEISPRQREALVLRYWLDLPLAAIADAMGVRLGTVKSLISRGLDRLAADMESYR